MPLSFRPCPAQETGRPARACAPSGGVLYAACAVLLVEAAAPGCASSAAVRGRAEVVVWDGVRVVAFCDSHQRYQLGVFTSTAAGSGGLEVQQWLAADASPVIVELTGYPALVPSGWEPAPGVAGVLSVGSIHPVERGKCF